MWRRTTGETPRHHRVVFDFEFRLEGRGGVVDAVGEGQLRLLETRLVGDHVLRGSGASIDSSLLGSVLSLISTQFS